jgi:hypothetical protein
MRSPVWVTALAGLVAAEYLVVLGYGIQVYRYLQRNPTDVPFELLVVALCVGTAVVALFLATGVFALLPKALPRSTRLALSLCSILPEPFVSVVMWFASWRFGWMQRLDLVLLLWFALCAAAPVSSLVAGRLFARRGSTPDSGLLER